MSNPRALEAESERRPSLRSQKGGPLCRAREEALCVEPEGRPSVPSRRGGLLCVEP